MSSDMELTYRQVTPNKAIGNDNFTQGVIDLNFSIGGKTGFVPSKSYMRVGLQLNGAGAAQATADQQVALADSCAANLFSNLYFRMGGQNVSSLTNSAPQVHACKMRLNNSGAFLNTIGKDAYFYDADFQRRVNRTSSSVLASLDSNPRYIKLGAPGSETTYTLAIAAAGGIVTGANTDFTNKVKVGDTLVVRGVEYTITAVTDDNTLTVLPAPAANVAATPAGPRDYALARQSNGDGRNIVYVMYQPCLGIFNHGGILGSGDYKLELNPNISYKTACAELAKVNAVAGPGADFDVIVQSLELYIATVKTDIPHTGVETLHLMESQVNSKQVLPGTDNQLEFTIPSSTKAISVFVQGLTAGSDPRLPPSKFKTLDDGDLTLRSIQLSYANQVKPATRWSSSFSATENRLQQRYLDTQLYSGQLFNPGGCESFSDWVKRGPLYHWSWERDADDRSTNLQIQVDYTALPVGGANLYVVAHHTKTVQIHTQNGFVTEVVSQSV